MNWFVPRLLEIIYEINRRFLGDVSQRFPDDAGRIQRMSIIDEASEHHVRMANLAIVGTHSTNGVAKIHSELLRTTTVKDLAEMFPERFSNKTNGITPRRWLVQANPALTRVITDAIGDNWCTDLGQLRQLTPLADDSSFRNAFCKAKRDAKAAFANWIKLSGQSVDPDTIFDCQIKRIHEYKRQLLNALRIVVLYNRLRQDSTLRHRAEDFCLCGKGSPGLPLGETDHQIH